ncbi:hypothetical protein CYMTET_27363 [Cymbomonas tetramitiformis]|uniref:Uncharacterized protein n=1 Tax=Cymbomonas tetramitiformis TaxID=36881 RepID=A0AAE0FPX9_9CHLO|nr:hypothetical protein CYMTET_27363 [Cymbomonas tetramitiformis]
MPGDWDCLSSLSEAISSLNAMLREKAEAEAALTSRLTKTPSSRPISPSTQPPPRVQPEHREDISETRDAGYNVTVHVSPLKMGADESKGKPATQLSAAQQPPQPVPHRDQARPEKDLPAAAAGAKTTLTAQSPHPAMDHPIKSGRAATAHAMSSHVMQMLQKRALAARLVLQQAGTLGSVKCTLRIGDVEMDLGSPREAGAVLKLIGSSGADSPRSETIALVKSSTTTKNATATTAATTNVNTQTITIAATAPPPPPPSAGTPTSTVLSNSSTSATCLSPHRTNAGDIAILPQDPTTSPPPPPPPPGAGAGTPTGNGGRPASAPAKPSRPGGHPVPNNGSAAGPAPGLPAAGNQIRRSPTAIRAYQQFMKERTQNLSSPSLTSSQKSAAVPAGGMPPTYKGLTATNTAYSDKRVGGDINL